MKVNILKKTAILALTLVLTLSQSTVLRTEAKHFSTVYNEEEWKVLKLVNEERSRDGYAPLSILKSLQTANKVRSEELFTSFSHTRPNGSDYSTVLSGIEYQKTGENIAAGYNSSQKVMSGWMHSSEHKANILDGSFTHMGVAHYHNPDGTYQHYWSQIFIGGCSPISISVNKSGRDRSYKIGTSIEKMNRVLEVKCIHGISYMPLISKICRGYNLFSTGVKKITVNYGGKNTSFKVNLTGTNIRKAKVSNVKNKTYNGKAQTQSPKIIINGVTLTKNKDYTLSYKRNRKKGNATMIITGKGAYSGTKKIKFKIK